jgi:hypothetical protein
MILKIILVFVFVKILIDYLWQKEGLDIDLPVLNATDDKGIADTCSINIKFPKYDSVKNLYTNDNNFLYNNFNNIKRSANPKDCN